MKASIFDQRLERHYDELKWLYCELYKDEAAFADFVEMLLHYQGRERRFGLTSEQVSGHRDK